MQVLEIDLDTTEILELQTTDFKLINMLEL